MYFAQLIMTHGKNKSTYPTPQSAFFLSFFFLVNLLLQCIIVSNFDRCLINIMYFQIQIYRLFLYFTLILF